MRTCHNCPKEKLIPDVTASLTPRLPARAQQSPSHPAGVAQERLQPARDRKGTAFPPFGTSHQPLVQLTFQRNWGLTCKTGRRDVIPRQPKAGAKFCYGRTACMSFASPLSGLSASRLSLTPSSVSFGNLSCIFLLNRRALVWWCWGQFPARGGGTDAGEPHPAITSQPPTSPHLSSLPCPPLPLHTPPPVLHSRNVYCWTAMAATSPGLWKFPPTAPMYRNNSEHPNVQKGFLVAQWSRIHLLMQETRVQSLDWEKLLEKETTIHWKIPWTKEPGGLWSMGSQKSETQLSN